MSAIRAQSLSAGYGRTTVLRGVDLVVPKGKTVALLGANGAGKTTLLRVLAGTLPKQGGSISLFGRPVDELAEHGRSAQGLCLVPQGSGVFPGLTVKENIAMFCRHRSVGEAIERAGEMFPVLTQRLNQVAGTMSGGQQQMLALSRPFVSKATIVLADELSLGLAPVILDEIFAAIDVLRSQGASLLIVEQFVERVLAVADYVYVLHKGQVVFVGEPGQCHEEGLFERYVGATV